MSDTYEMPDGWYRPDGTPWATVGEQAHAIREAVRLAAAIRCPICRSVNEHSLSCPTRWYR